MIGEWPSLADILQQLRWQDIADILILTVVLFRIYLWLRGTVALQVLIGVVFLLATAFVASRLELTLTAYVLQTISAVVTFIIVVVFRTEIRQALLRANPFRWWRERQSGGTRNGDVHTRLARAVFTLAAKHVGALVIVPRGDPVSEHLTGGTELDALVSGELMEAVFQKESPIHDGAAAVVDGRLRVAGAFLPLSTAPDLPQTFGTRHRAAVGFSERCDALVLVVSEERGCVSLVSGGQAEEIGSADALERRLRHAFEDQPGAGSASRGPLGLGWLPADAATFLAILLLVSGAWYVVAGSRGTVVLRSVAVAVRGADPRLDVSRPEPSSVTLYLRGPQRLVTRLGEDDLEAWVDISGSRGDGGEFPVQTAPPPGIAVERVDPEQVSVQVRRTASGS